MPVSQEILPLGNFAAAAIFPRIYCRPLTTQPPNFLGNIGVIRKYCRSETRGHNRRLSDRYRAGGAKTDQDQYDRLLHYVLTGNFRVEMAEAEKDSLRKLSKNFLVKNGLLYFQKKNADI